MLNLIAFCLILFAIFYILKINPIKFSNEIFTSVIKEKPKSIKTEVQILTKKKKENFFINYVKDTENTLRKIGKIHQLPFVFFVSLTSAFFGIIFAFTIENYFLAPVLATIFLTLPFIYIKTISNLYKKELDEELEITLSMITTSYNRTENIITSIEDNLEYLNEPVASSFRKFIANVNIDPNINKAIEELKSEYSNPIFKEWCDNLLLCQDDKSLKIVLQPIVKKLSDIRIINSEIDVLLTRPKNLFTTLFLACLVAPFFAKMLPKDFIGTFFETNFGNITVSAMIGIAFFCYIQVLKIVEPMEE